jgi:hypothetical protein
MPIAKGISKQVAIKKESTWGTLAGASGARYLRRVTSAFNLTKETYQSDEIRTDYQMADYRHGVRSAEGSISAEFSPGSYSDLFAAALARDFTSGVAITGAAINTAAGAGSTYTLTRGAGSYFSDGFRVGDVVRITAATGLNADTLNKNLLIVALTATVATVVVLNGSTITVPGTGTAVSLSVTGKKTWVPQSGHTSDSFTVEEWFANITQSEVYTGVKVNTVGISLPATGMSTLDFGLMGKDLTLTGTTQYFTSPTAQSTSGVFAGVNGRVIFNGSPVAVITDATININRNINNATVLGSNSIAEVFDGRCIVDGSLSIYFTDAIARDAFKDETEVSLVFTLTTGNTANSDFVSITLPRVKLNSFTKDDGESGITASTDFQALLNPTSGASEVTTISIQDSLAA